MKKKYKCLLVIILLILIIIFILFIIFKDKDYNNTYKVDGYLVYEEYNSNLNAYYITISIDNNVYENEILSKYDGKNLIDEINVYSDGDTSCVIFISSKLDTYPACFSDSESVSYHLLSDLKIYNYNTTDLDNNVFESITTYYLFDKNYAVWTGYGYLYFNKDGYQELNFLSEEVYYNNYSYSNSRYVITPNYDESYVYDQIYILDMKNGKVKLWDLEEEISYNFYYLGVYNDLIYLVDRKNVKEYSINPKKRDLNIVSEEQKGIVWNNKWESVSMVKLINTDYSFNNTRAYTYYIEDNKLYLSYYKGKNSILISEDARIVKSEDDFVYYISGDSLYRYSPTYGEYLVATYSEWQFNTINDIYIY